MTVMQSELQIKQKITQALMDKEAPQDVVNFANALSAALDAIQLMTLPPPKSFTAGQVWSGNCAVRTALLEILPRYFDGGKLPWQKN